MTPNIIICLDYLYDSPDLALCGFWSFQKISYHQKTNTWLPLHPPLLRILLKYVVQTQTIIQNEDGRTKRWEESWRCHGATELAT